MKVKFAGTWVTLSGKEVKVGDIAPEFIAVKNDLGTFKLSDIKGRKLISAVPSLDTSVCDLETRRFNSEATALRNTTILTISMDLPFAQKRWCGAAGVDKVITISDYKDRDFAMKYGVYLPNVGLLARAIFILDENNTVQYVEYVPEVSTHPNYEAALATLR